MPDDVKPGEADAGRDPDWEADYKKLQRKLNRSNKRNDDLAKRVAESEASMRRTETMVERLLDGDADAEFKQQIAAQRSQDSTAVQLEVELASLLEEKDLDFDTDPKLGEARRLVAEINRTGNMELVNELKRTINDATTVGSGPETEEERTQAAILADRQAHGRVDTGHTTAPVDSKLRYVDIANLDPSEGVPAMREKMKQALDQMMGQ